MKHTTTRRTFVKQTGVTMAYTFFLGHLMSCKQDGTKLSQALSSEPYVLPNTSKTWNIRSGQPYEMAYVRGDVGYFTERGGTIGWLANNEGIVIVDTQFPDQAGNLYTEMEQINRPQIDLIINTHHHGDHTSGNIFFKDKCNTVLAHRNSRVNQYEVSVERETQAETLLPTEVFTETITKQVAGESITLHYFGPGHTNGDAIVHFQNANVVHMGDLVFNRRFPYIDKRAGADIKNWISVLDKAVYTFDKDTLFLYGHSDNGFPVYGQQGDLIAFKDYLSRLLDFTRTSMAKGIKAEDLIAQTQEIPGATQWKGRGIERSIEAAYLELGG